jgi:cytochrome c biogenesis protein CcmG/thiol:disulfide interchange protein DsbE
MTMRTFQQRFLGAVVLTLAAGTMPAHAIETGQGVPAFSVTKLGGGAITQADVQGSVVYLDFWASWCGPCRHSFPWMNEMQAKYGPKGLKILAINLDQKSADAEAFLKQNPANFTVALDPKSEAPTKFQVKGMPTSYLIAADGKVTKVHAGFRPEDQKEREAAIEQALKAGGGAK